MKEPATDLKKDRSHQNPKDTKHIVRFPRLIRRFPRLPIRRYCRETAEDVAFFRTARLIGELEVKAHEWLARGREANTEFGRILIRLKPLVGHGHFKEYYERKFGQPYHIKFRTAQTYMKMAREQDKAKGAGLALFPPATDPHSVAIREAAERARQGVADAPQGSSSDSASNCKGIGPLTSAVRSFAKSCCGKRSGFGGLGSLRNTAHKSFIACCPMAKASSACRFRSPFDDTMTTALASTIVVSAPSQDWLVCCERKYASTGYER